MEAALLDKSFTPLRFVQDDKGGTVVWMTGW